ncbi:restriction endonuclease subunit S [Flavobacteriaceae bacterium]|nr:restriction endonuclease subunit S [Flavobacteriaceae bacterium]
MKRYDSYKDSGVEWMNKIPSNWEKSRIRMVGDLYGGLTGKKGSDFNDEDNSSNKPFVPFTNIFNNTYISKDHFQYVNVEENENQNRVLKNDLFFLMSSESYEDLGKCSILLEDVEELYLNSFCKGFRIKDSKVYPLFLNYQLLGSLHKEMISIEGNGFTRINLRQDRLLDIPVFIPPLSEQQQIVSFLDTKTSLIDSLIEKTQRKIELLKEKRTSLINEVVTKGLNSNVEMKDSGVEWIGDIPSHWKVSRIKFYLNGIIDTEHKTVPFHDDGKYYVIRTPNIRNGKLQLKDCKMTNEDGFREWTVRGVPEPNDVLLTREGPVGESCVIPNDISFCMGQRVVWLKLKKEKINPYYLVNTIYSVSSKIFMDNISLGSTLSHLNMSEIGNIPILYCPFYEQQQIVEYLDEQTQLIDKTISIEEKRIELLKEYRQSLISEVVTGKRKVV